MSRENIMGRSLRAVIMRGGTSKAIFLKEADLPQDEAARDTTILRVFGSPDKRQIDGLGGADPLTSKLAIIGPAREGVERARDTHITYTFGQVEIDHPDIDWYSLCGNISAAVGAFAIYEGMVAPTSPLTLVRCYNTNLDRVLTIEVPVENGRPLEAGDYVVPGVPGAGARIQVDFSDTAGGTTGALLPTGNATDILTIPDFGDVEVTLIDTGNAHVFVRAQDLGLTGTETAAEIDQNKPLIALLEKIRGAGAFRMGMVSSPEAARKESPATPLIGMVSKPADYRDVIGDRTVAADEVDLVSRLMFMQQMHKAYAATSTACTGVASQVPGTLVYEMTRPEARTALRNRREVRIGHPAGVIETETELEEVGEGYKVKRATVARTARRIMEGYVFVPE
jgi:2-methylaconitate cis-trans-isomerase PrpF